LKKRSGCVKWRIIYLEIVLMTFEQIYIRYLYNLYTKVYVYAERDDDSDDDDEDDDEDDQEDDEVLLI
jgi:hypothetical protein